MVIIILTLEVQRGTTSLFFFCPFPPYFQLAGRHQACDVTEVVVKECHVFYYFDFSNTSSVNPASLSLSS
jgi:hypothetical protein